MRFSFFLLLILGISQTIGFAQKRTCGTVTPANAAALEQQISFRAGAPAVTNCLNKILSVRFIVVTDSLNDPGISAGDLNGAISDLNDIFSPICLSFSLCDVDTVYAYKYNRWDRNVDHAEFEVNYTDAEIINVAVVEQITFPLDAAGYAPLGIGSSSAPHYDLIVVQKSGISGTLIHEVGHYFGLYHTFETSLGLEFVNGSNCLTTGDLLCDTPADIDPAPIAQPCIWNGTNTDPNNDYYTPQLGNVMSYHPSTCGSILTIDQYNRVIYCYTNFRNYLH